jgi:ABC-type Fe3+ transport system substrate-binding protein
LVGPLPGELQNVIVYAAGVASRARNAALARAFIAFMGADKARRILRANGLEPGQTAAAAWLGESAKTLAPSRFYTHIGLTWDGSADTYRPLFGRR